VGKGVMRGCAEQVKRVTLELGGKNANIVFADADLAAAAAATPGGAFDNAGQDCCARSRLLVQRCVLDDVLAALEPAVQGFTCARSGAGVEPDGSADLGGTAGPSGLLALRRRGRPVRLANDTAYGLSGSIWTRDVGRALRVSRAVEAGNLSVNSHASVRYSTPFGGFKQSGLGRELGPDALDAFSELKTVFIADS
jgi:aldehyde dehydrogenase (NAD+)